MKRLSFLLAFLVLLSLILSACGTGSKDRPTNEIRHVEPVPEPEWNLIEDQEYSEDSNDSDDSDDVSSESEESTSGNAKKDDMIALTEARVSRAVLMETRNVWFRSNISASYEKFVEHIGCEASAYSQSSDFLTYAWHAFDDSNARLYVNYMPEGDGSWKLYSLMSYSLDE